jgi:phosphohistidine swiveling domain-containing protein
MTNYIGNPLSIDRLLTLIEGHNPERIHFNKKKKVSDEFQFVLNVAKCVAYVRQAGSEYSSIFSYKLLPYLNSIAEKLGVSYREMLYLTPDEIISFLKDGTSPMTVIQKRSGYNWLIFGDKKEELHISDQRKLLKNLESRMVPQVEAGTKIFTGQIGNKGRARGIVRIVIAIDDFHKMRDGDILVTTMTTPDFVVLMQKASGIVTDTGGLLSHASIVSRELNKPCIIGTKIATQVLHDGDLVEVDAERGIVKILKKADANNNGKNVSQSKNKAESCSFRKGGADKGVVRIIEKKK